MGLRHLDSLAAALGPAPVAAVCVAAWLVSHSVYRLLWLHRFSCWGRISGRPVGRVSPTPVRRRINKINSRGLGGLVCAAGSSEVPTAFGRALHPLLLSAPIPFSLLPMYSVCVCVCISLPRAPLTTHVDKVQP